MVEEFLAGDSACLILGDNIYYGQGMTQMIENAKKICESDTGGECVGTLISKSQKLINQYSDYEIEYKLLSLKDIDVCL